MAAKIGFWGALAALMLVGNAAVAEPLKLRIGTEGTYRPMSYYDAAGNLTGFEVELVRLICARMQADCEFVAIDFEVMVPYLDEGRIDAMASGVRITEKRRKAVDFTRKYYTPTVHFASCKHAQMSSVTPEDLKGFVIGGQTGSSSADFVKDKYGAVAEVRLYKTMDEAFADAKAGRLDAVFASTLVGYGFVQANKESGCALIGSDFSDPKYFGDGVGMALKKGNDTLRTALDSAIESVLNDGSFDKLNQQYWPFSIK